jgi:perosamine synthetase
MSGSDLHPDDIRAVETVLKSGRLALGPQAVEFEHAVARYVGTKHAVALSSGSAALHLLVRAAGVGPGDEVLVPSFTFVSTVNSILYEGACPVFVEIRPTDLNLDPDDVEHRITARTRAILAVDIFGHPADWQALDSLAARHGLILIDDCCEAFGGEYRGRKLGSFGLGGAFGFYPNKQLTTGEGGMLVTGDAAVALAAREMRNQGREDTDAFLSHPRLGFNYRMDEMSAALGLSQLARIETLLQRRSRVAAWYDERLAAVSGLSRPQVAEDVRKSWFAYVVILESSIDRPSFMADLAGRGIPTRAYFPPVHLQPYVRERLATRAGQLPITEALAERTVALPFHGGLDEADVERVARACAAAVG